MREEEEEGKPSESMPSETFYKFLINAFSCMLYIKNKMKKEKPQLATLIVDGMFRKLTIFAAEKRRPECQALLICRLHVLLEWSNIRVKSHESKIFHP